MNTRRLFLYFLLLLSPAWLQARQQDTLFRLYKTKQFSHLHELNNNPSHPLYYFYSAAYANACNQPAISNQLLKKYIKKKKQPATFIAFDYYSLLHDNYVRSFQYREAARSGQYLLKHYSDRYKGSDLQGQKYATLIWKALTGEPAQQIKQPVSDSIPFKRDIAGLINIQVTSSGQQGQFIFDTGAGLSSVSESYARQLGFRILPDTGIYVAGFTGIYNPVRIAVAPELRFGSIVIYNEPFLVFRDEALSFANGAYKINGIIGFPVAKELGRITITRKSLLIDAHREDNSFAKNFFVEQLRPIVLLGYKGKLLPFNFDTGAGSSDFLRPFYELDSNALKATGKYVDKQSASAGGAHTRRILEIPNLKLELGNHTVSIPLAGVDPSAYHISSQELYGNIGQDLLKQYNKVILDFGNNVLRLEL